MRINIILFTDFETLDVFGPVQIFGKVQDISLHFYSPAGGLVGNGDGVQVDTLPISQLLSTPHTDTLFIPGGIGTRVQINNSDLIKALKHLGTTSQYALTVCTGSALLAQTGLLDGLRATSNKMSFDWVKSTNTKVNWQPKARWVVDGKFYTSSGISAGIDMALGFVADVYGLSSALQIAHRIEYVWNSNKNDDAWSKEIRAN